MALLVGVLLVLVLVLALQHHLRAYIKFRKIELSIPGPPTLPILGNALDFFNVTEETVFPLLFKIWGYRYELSRFSLLGRLIVIVSDPDDIERVMKRRDLQDKSRFFYEFIEIFSRRGLVTLNGAEWRSHRRALQPAFHQDVLDRYMDIFSAESATFVQRMVPFQEQDVLGSLRDATSRAFLRTSLCEMDEETEQTLSTFVDYLVGFTRSLNARSFQPLLWPDAIFCITQPGRALRDFKERADKFATKVISRRRAELGRRSASGSEDDEDFIKQRRTLIDVLLSPQKKVTGGKLLEMSDSEILDEFKIFLAAAVETTVAALGWTIKVLSVRPEIQERVRAEIAEQLAGKEALTTADINKLTYTEQVIKETMRLLPPVPLTARNVMEDTELAGHKLPANTTLVINIIGCHRDPKHWPDPMRFDPERFSPEQCANRHPFAYIPFSSGMHNCIGGRYAMMLMKSLMAALLQRYRIDAVPDGHTEPVDFPITFDVSSRMLGGVRVKLTPRVGCAA